MPDYVARSTLGHMEVLEHVAVVAIAAGAAVVFALMAWAGQHQS
jgi:hypothetical protein